MVACFFGGAVEIGVWLGDKTVNFAVWSWNWGKVIAGEVSSVAVNLPGELQANEHLTTLRLHAHAPPTITTAIQAGIASIAAALFWWG